MQNHMTFEGEFNLKELMFWVDFYGLRPFLLASIIFFKVYFLSKNIFIVLGKYLDI